MFRVREGHAYKLRVRNRDGDKVTLSTGTADSATAQAVARMVDECVRRRDWKLPNALVLGARFELALPDGERDFKKTAAPATAVANPLLYRRALHDDAPKRTAPATTSATTRYALSTHPIFPALEALVLMAGMTR